MEQEGFGIIGGIQRLWENQEWPWRKLLRVWYKFIQGLIRV